MRWLFVIDLIMENSPWHCSQMMQGLWHLREKYSCCAGFCHKMPVDKAWPWQTARRDKDGERERLILKKERQGLGEVDGEVRRDLIESVDTVGYSPF